MKKLLPLSLILLILCSCGAPTGNSTPTPTPSESAQSESPAPTPTGSPEVSPSDSASDLDASGEVDADQNLFDVTITVPADFVGATTQEELDQQATEDGFKSITLNEDGSATWVMTKAKHKEMMDEISESIDQSLSEMAGSEEYPSISSIESNDDYTDFTVTITGDALSVSESVCVLALSVQSGMYHIFNGTNVDNVHVSFVSSATGEVIEDWNSSEA